MMSWICFLYVIFLNVHRCLNKMDIYERLKDEIEQYAKNQYPETTEIRSHYDYIIVGAGSAGCVLANRLSEISNSTILLLEAGGPESRKYDIPSDVQSLQHTEIDWKYVSEPSRTFSLGLKEQRIAIPRGKVVGGSSVINAMVYNRGNPNDYERWAKFYNCYGWSYNEVKKYFKKLENYAVYNVEDNNFFGKNGPVNVEIPSYHSELSNCMLEAGMQYGLQLIETNEPNQIGISRVRATIKDGFRFSSNSAYLMPIRNSRPNLDLKYICLVTKILFDNDLKPKAVGVNFSCDSKNYSIYANKEVIISAGAINSPQLLMLSGIGPANHLKDMGIPIIKNLPVGHNLMDHVKVINLQFLVNKTVFPSVEQQEDNYVANRSGKLAIPGGLEVISFSNPTNGIQTIEHLFASDLLNEQIAKNIRLKDEIYQTTFKPYASSQGFRIISQLLKPKSHGIIQLRTTNPFDPPKIFLNYFSNREDILILIKAIKEAIKISEQKALQDEWNATLINTKIPLCSQYEFNTDEYWECSIVTTASTNFHQSGTCKMGSKNDPTAVVDPELKVIGVDNLRVVDASIMPELIGAHPNGPIMMIAEKGADMIKASYHLS